MPVISNQQFRTLNGNVRLWGGKLNQWVVLLEDADLAAVLAANGERNALPAATEAIQKWWWSYTNETISTDAIRATGLWRASIRLPEGRGRIQVQPWPLDLDPSRYVFVGMEFVPAADRSMQWPWVWTPIVGSWDEPSSGLVATYDPAQAVHVPTAIEQLGDTLERTGDELAADAAKAAKAVKKALGTGLTVAVVVGLAVLALWPRKG